MSSDNGAIEMNINMTKKPAILTIHIVDLLLLMMFKESKSLILDEKFSTKIITIIADCCLDCCSFK